MRWTCFNFSWTKLQSPPLEGSPQVRTVPSVKIAAKALEVPEISCSWGLDGAVVTYVTLVQDAESTSLHIQHMQPWGSDFTDFTRSSPYKSYQPNTNSNHNRWFLCLSWNYHEPFRPSPELSPDSPTCLRLHRPPTLQPSHQPRGLQRQRQWHWVVGHLPAGPVTGVAAWSLEA